MNKYNPNEHQLSLPSTYNIDRLTSWWIDMEGEALRLILASHQGNLSLTKEEITHITSEMGDDKYHISLYSADGKMKVSYGDKVIGTFESSYDVVARNRFYDFEHDYTFNVRLTGEDRKPLTHLLVTNIKRMEAENE